jgi:hypothetical protein
MPVPWLLADILTLAATLVVIVFIIQRSRHPAVVLLECFGFVFLYASVFENFAVVNQWYVYGRSLLMIGDVPLSVPLIEMDVLVIGLWMLDKMNVPDWCKPVIVGFLGMLQDFSLDPVAVRQVFTVEGVTTGRWTWLLEPGMVNIFNIPVYNFPGWMLIMLYASAYLLLGRWWFRRSGYKPVVGYLYPFVGILLALITMVSPLSRFLLWLGPIFEKGSNAEWIMLGFHLAVSVILLAILWRGRMKYAVTLKDDWPVYVVPLFFHLCDILFAVAGGYNEVLWLIVLASFVHLVLLAVVYYSGRKLPALPSDGFLFGP